MIAVRPALLAALLAASAPLAAQPAFQEITPATGDLFVNPENEDFWLSTLAPADVDGDGDLDLAAFGFYVVYNESVEDRLLVLRNDGANGAAWQLTPLAVPLGEIYPGRSDLAWADVDGDGDPDLAVASEGAMVLYRNDAGTLAATTTALPAYLEDSEGTIGYDLRSLNWADSDNDGDLDLLVPSVFDFENFEFGPTRLLRNDGADAGGSFSFTDSGAALDPTRNAHTDWADDDGDGDVDLMVTEIDTNGDGGFVRRYRNDGDDGFVASELLPIRVHHGVTDRADIDGDGDLDLLVAGNIEENEKFATVLRVYRNDAGTYVAEDLALPAPEWLDVYAASLADYDSDGDVDLLLTGDLVGDGELYGLSEIYGNDGSGTFTALGVQLPAPVTTVGRGGAFTWLDLDDDGDLDYLVSGAYYIPGGNGLVESRVQIFRNVTLAANAPPQVPASLAAATAGDEVALTWLAAGDDHNASDELTYDVRVARTGPPADSTKRLPEPGPVKGTSWTLRGLAPGDYAWSVQAIDAAFAESAKVGGTFRILGGDTMFRDGFE